MSPERRGRPKYLTLEHEACEILETLAQGKKAQGYLLSSLLRQEEQRRATMRRLREVVAQDVERVIDWR